MLIAVAMILVVVPWFYLLLKDVFSYASQKEWQRCNRVMGTNFTSEKEYMDSRYYKLTHEGD